MGQPTWKWAGLGLAGPGLGRAWFGQPVWWLVVISHRACWLVDGVDGILGWFWGCDDGSDLDLHLCEVDLCLMWVDLGFQ